MFWGFLAKPLQYCIIRHDTNQIHKSKAIQKKYFFKSKILKVFFFFYNVLTKFFITLSNEPLPKSFIDKTVFINK